MDQQSIQWALLMLLTKHYEEDYRRFVVIPQLLMKTPPLRAAIAALTREDYVEERAKGVLRLSPDGYLMCQKELLGFERCERE
jgi:hypothetical protein